MVDRNPLLTLEVLLSHSGVVTVNGFRLKSRKGEQADYTFRKQKQLTN